jgi:Kef-type K+ transport system membrane component KefB
VVISSAGIIVPFVLGLAIAGPLWKDFGSGPAFVPFAFFVATALSITAFPVLVRILAEHHLLRTRLGTLALTCAASDDVIAWLLLAVLSSIAKTGGLADAASMFGVLVVWVAAMLVLAPRLLARWRHDRLMPILFLSVSAAVAEAIGVHAVFGGFLAGAVVPLSEEQRRETRERLLPVGQLLLPLFFASSGLRTDFRLLLDEATLGASAVILLVAVAGKLGGLLVCSTRVRNRVARGAESGSANEHSRPHGTRCAQHRLRPRSGAEKPLRGVRGHGRGDDLRDLAASACLGKRAPAPAESQLSAHAQF